MTPTAAPTLKIKDVAERTGVAAATIRMWEQRHGFPNPQRTAGGYRLYTDEDVETIRAVLALRRRGLSIPVAIERAHRGASIAVEPHPSIYTAVTAVDPNAYPRVLRRSTLAAMSHAIEDEFLSRGASGIVVGAFQRQPFYARVAHRYEQMAPRSDITLVFADFPDVSGEAGQPVRVPIAPTDALGNEWAVVVDAPGYAACLLAWERPNRPAGGERMFEAVLSMDPLAVRRAVQVASALAGRRDAQLGARLDGLVDGRALATEPPASALTALTGRMVAYLDEAGTAAG
ncbi:MAG: MerR family transcriptional regulator [Patulibacter minatonensis]